MEGAPKIISVKAKGPTTRETFSLGTASWRGMSEMTWPQTENCQNVVNENGLALDTGLGKHLGTNGGSGPHMRGREVQSPKWTHMKTNIFLKVGLDK